MKQLNNSDYISSVEPNKEYLGLCRQRNDFFNSPSWQKVVATLGASTSYFWNHEVRDGFAVSSFKRGPFSLSYVSFPVGRATLSRDFDHPDVLEHIISCCLKSNVGVLRVPGLTDDALHGLDYQSAQVVETVIEDLSEWQYQGLASGIKRNVRKAHKSEVSFKNRVEVSDASRLYSLYAATVKRHNGVVHYNIRYFSALVELANSEQSAVDIYAAFFSGKLIAYTIVAADKSSAVYLHGAQDLLYQKYRSMDALFHTMIGSAKLIGLTRFSFLSSPVGQASLIRYKEKWGGSSSPNQTITVYGRGLLASALKFIIWARG